MLRPDNAGIGPYTWGGHFYVATTQKQYSSRRLMNAQRTDQICRWPGEFCAIVVCGISTGFAHLCLFQPGQVSNVMRPLWPG